ncbi:MAG: hypothetical protein WAK86_05620 [Pseudonocardiaceae bacterium]
MSSLPPELVDPVQRLRVKLVAITDSEQSDMTNIVASASHAERVPEIQAVLARCRQRSAAAAAAAIDTFRDEFRDRRARHLVDRDGDRCCCRQERLGVLDEVGELRCCLRR